MQQGEPLNYTHFFLISHLTLHSTNSKVYLLWKVQSIDSSAKYDASHKVVLVLSSSRKSITIEVLIVLINVLLWIDSVGYKLFLFFILGKLDGCPKEFLVNAIAT
jgi:hypothetical protein